jgi:hypothetical protein
MPSCDLLADPIAERGSVASGHDEHRISGEGGAL